MDSDFLRMAGNSGWNFDGERFLAIAPEKEILVELNAIAPLFWIAFAMEAGDYGNYILIINVD